MEIKITSHAAERMAKYAISKELLASSIGAPDSIMEGKGLRKILQKRLNGYILRIIIEEEKDIKTVITAYKARSNRYEI